MSENVGKLLPLGSVVLLKEGMQKLVIVGRGVVYTDQVTEEEKFADYMGAIYPTGVNPQSTIFFDHENIDKVVFKGYSDEEEARFLELYSKWKDNLNKEKSETDNGNESFGF